MAESDCKAQLASEIFSASILFSSCAHRGRSRNAPPFVDWYLILRVDEEAEADVIKKQYRRLALQLHPDKNRHPKAEAAFKVVSEAYECLSDKTTRRVFNSQRRKFFCSECHRQKFQPSLSRTINNHENPSPGFQKLRRALTALKEARKRFQEECNVIEACLNLNTNATFQDASPVFDPSLYLHHTSYPHSRRIFESSDGQKNMRKTRCESPVYEIRTDQKSSRRKNCSFGI
ncbi:chaperone protein DnaJ-like [Zingiber officinale]|uniref:J domain-containing protein n=1 Tax=Zingiber officinale TaxID=94328 RepID=A0A8J5LJ80_ZINOF|nr:chaperone protein DnaJ-like [Zingiber officinale]KAG6517413.1 hypothetical protein ZIOFF_020803 [Zingiber officinale]